ncbi:uncharacterized protein [Diadema setosum]|uniref:uncharacterized protein n=1 Tax=Diadema setosum TaxID=31175 RepID=UPI003B39FFA2
MTVLCVAYYFLSFQLSEAGLKWNNGFTMVRRPVSHSVRSSNAKSLISEKDSQLSLLRNTSKRETSVASEVRNPENEHVVILTTTNYAYIDMTCNWLESLKRCGLNDRVIIVAEDEPTFRLLRNQSDPNLQVWLPFGDRAELSNDTEFLHFGSDKYIRLVNRRPTYILYFLDRKMDVLFTDVDTVWLKNPMSFLRNNFDLQLEMDQHDDGKDYKDIRCAGFVYYRASEATRGLVRRWIERVKLQPKVPDQILLNDVLSDSVSNESLNISILDPVYFPNGNEFFNQAWRNAHPDIDPVVLHNNWIEGYDVKIQRFKEYGLWYL